MTNETKERTKHTPTPLPWGLVEVEAIAGVKAIKAWQLISRDGKNTIASGLNVADGKRIAIAVASHDELVAAAKILLDNWPENRDGMDDAGPLPHGVKSMRAALAKAEGR